MQRIMTIKSWLLRNASDLLIIIIVISIIIGVLLVLNLNPVCIERYIGLQHLIMYCGFLVSGLVAFLALEQFKANYHWKRKEYTFQLIIESENKWNECQKLFSEKFQYDRYKPNESIPGQTIVKEIFELDKCNNIRKEGNKIVFREDRQAIDIRMALWKALNTADILAYAVRCELIDKKVVEDIVSLKLVKLYNNFKEIIDEINRCYDSNEIWGELKTLANEFSKSSTIDPSPGVQPAITKNNV